MIILKNIIVFLVFVYLQIIKFITRLTCAQDRPTILCLYVPGFHRQVFKHVKILSEQSKRMKEKKKKKGSVLDAESAYNAQNAQFGLVIFEFKKNRKRTADLKFEVDKVFVNVWLVTIFVFIIIYSK